MTLAGQLLVVDDHLYLAEILDTAGYPAVIAGSAEEADLARLFEWVATAVGHGKAKSPRR